MKTFSVVDEGNGTVMTCWDNVRERVAKVEPKFAAIVDNIGPSKKLPLFLIYLPYGALKGDTKCNFIPSMDGSFYRLSDLDAPNEINQHLIYGVGSSPLTMVLEKNIEFFIDIKTDNITLPRKINGPGFIFPHAQVFADIPKKTFVPNGVLSVSSGARSVFMLPQISCAINHSRLKSDYKINSATPRGLYDHWQIFSEIVNSEIVNSKWRSCLMYFSEGWVNNIRSDKKWLELKTYLLEKGCRHFDYETASAVYHNFIYSTIQRERNLKPNPYIADTARHILTIGLGQAPGYVPICDEESLPLAEIQQAYVHAYGLKKYHPTIIGPAYFDSEAGCKPVYYSLQYPSTHDFSPKSRTMSSFMYEMKELIHVLRVFVNELSKESSMCFNTALEKIAEELNFTFYHNKACSITGIANTNKLSQNDPRFTTDSINNPSTTAAFSADGKFLRGCVKIAHNKSVVDT